MAWYNSRHVDPMLKHLIDKQFRIGVADVSMLANCCALGSGCAPPPGASIAWDGVGSAAADDTEPVEPQPKKHARAKRQMLGQAALKELLTKMVGPTVKREAASEIAVVKCH
jgi:hypothetical protein